MQATSNKWSREIHMARELRFGQPGYRLCLIRLMIVIIRSIYTISLKQCAPIIV